VVCVFLLFLFQEPHGEQLAGALGGPLLHEPEQVESMLDSDLEGPAPERLHLMNFAEIITNCIQVWPPSQSPPLYQLCFADSPCVSSPCVLRLHLMNFAEIITNCIQV